MKKLMIIGGVVLVLVLGLMVWLAGSVGPETAPKDVRSIDLPDSYGN
ncbi:hypothetical protein [uncultured Algimonas sp.]|nr:hypothetical protein [uncultured Algimonas sp.]